MKFCAMNSIIDTMQKEGKKCIEVVMAHQVKWTRDILDNLYKYAMLNENEQYIMESRIKGTPVSLQADRLCCSEATVHRMIAKIKKKYDTVQKEHPDLFPIRKKSAKETWMDEN